jgi:hypothetical protein
MCKSYKFSHVLFLSICQQLKVKFNGKKGSCFAHSSMTRKWNSAETWQNLLHIVLCTRSTQQYSKKPNSVTEFPHVTPNYSYQSHTFVYINKPGRVRKPMLQWKRYDAPVYCMSL